MKQKSPLQNLKAKLIPGNRLRSTTPFHENMERTIVHAQTNSWSMSVPGKTEASWCNLPKASEITEPEAALFVIVFPDVPGRSFTYDFRAV